MADVDLNADVAPETRENGDLIERAPDGSIVKITNTKGIEYTARNLSAKGNAELIQRVEDYRWAHHLTVAEFVLKATEGFLDASESTQA